MYWIRNWPFAYDSSFLFNIFYYDFLCVKVIILYTITNSIEIIPPYPALVDCHILWRSFKKIIDQDVISLMQHFEHCFFWIAGYFCEGPGVVDYTQFPCPNGHYCPAGTIQSYDHPCPGENSDRFSECYSAVELVSYVQSFISHLNNLLLAFAITQIYTKVLEMSHCLLCITHLFIILSR